MGDPAQLRVKMKTTWINCPHCGKRNCAVQCEDGGITEICSETGKVRNARTRVSGKSAKAQRSLRSLEVA
jgi:hypothetical protein